MIKLCFLEISDFMMCVNSVWLHEQLIIESHIQSHEIVKQRRHDSLEVSIYVSSVIIPHFCT